MLTLYSYPELFGVADNNGYGRIDAGIYGFIANIYFYEIDTPLRQFVVAHGNIARHCRAIHDAMMAKQA